MQRLLSRLIFGLGLLIAISPLAHADLLLEPYVGYMTGKGSWGDVKHTDNGFVYGARVGYQNLGFMIGLDYMSGKFTDDATPENDITPSDLGAFIGYNFPVMLRVYGEYGFSAKSNFVNSTGTYKYAGNSYKIGVGFTGLPVVSINLEYYGSTFDEENGTSLSPDLKTNMVGLTVSLPFVL